MFTLWGRQRSPGKHDVRFSPIVLLVYPLANGAGGTNEPLDLTAHEPASSRSPSAAGLGGGPGGGGGQREDHGEPAAGGIFGFHGAAHRLGQAAGYRPAEPDAGTGA